jgi:hypothetical protein
LVIGYAKGPNEFNLETSSMTRYRMLVRVLDGIRSESENTRFATKYAVGSEVTEDLAQARARAYIHLYLKVMFGIEDFKSREEFITDGGYDGGIDGYYIDSHNQKIIVLQSKFRSTESNFENKPIEVDEVLAMQVRRVLSGELLDITGKKYNGKIQGFQRRVTQITHLARYKISVVILANVSERSLRHIERLTDGFPAEVFDFSRAYNELLFPVLCGTLFRASEVSVSLDISNKSQGSKISYVTYVDQFKCDMKVIFVPTIEIARILTTYKNSLLTFNPRNYLAFEGEEVNSAIKGSIVSRTTNDFALLNNGITIVCDESGISDHTGQKHQSSLFMLNPQIINGGQTAFTLSRVYEDCPHDQRQSLFAGKEVLLKIIGLKAAEHIEDERAARVALIKRISTATNSQSVVTLADRQSDDPVHKKLQTRLFERYGIIYETKRGEFSIAVKDQNLYAEDILDKTLFIRLFMTANSRIDRALRRRILREPFKLSSIDDAALDQFYIAYRAFLLLTAGIYSPKTKYTTLLPQVYAAVVFSRVIKDENLDVRLHIATENVKTHWQSFLAYAAEKKADYVKVVMDYSDAKSTTVELKEKRNSLGYDFAKDIEEYFGAFEPVED